MFPRLPASIEADILLGAVTTVRTVFPNSRLDSLNNQHNQYSQQQQHLAAANAVSARLTPPYEHHLHNAELTSTLDAPTSLATATAAAAATATAAAAADTSGSSFLPAVLPDDDDWWSNAIEEDTFSSPLPFDASENGLWNGRFVPPPPRPPFLDDNVAADGLTTCDLCTWAWQRNAYSLDGSKGKS